MITEESAILVISTSLLGTLLFFLIKEAYFSARSLLVSTSRCAIRGRWDWRVQETDVIQQEEGQAFWIYKGRSQHVQTAPVPITPEQIQEGWREIRRQEAMQRQLLELEERRRQERQTQKQQNT